MSNSNSDQEIESNIQIIIAGEKPNEFSTYDYKTALAKALEKHRNFKAQVSAEKPLYECQLCDYKSLRKFNYEEHMRKHTGECPYICDVCGYKTIHKRCHRLHVSTHYGEKPYECNVCSYKTMELTCLQKHVRRHATPKPETQYDCSICDFKATDSRNLRFHTMKMHMGGKKRHECQLCDYTSTRPSDLRRHKLTHSNNKEKICNFCDISSAEYAPST